MFRSWQEPPFGSAGRAGRDDRDAFDAQHSEITVIVPFISPMAAKRPSFAGITRAERKNSSPTSARSIPYLTRFACRFGSSPTMIMAFCSYDLIDAQKRSKPNVHVCKNARSTAQKCCLLVNKTLDINCSTKCNEVIIKGHDDEQ
jgi:hypothetical protein